MATVAVTSESARLTPQWAPTDTEWGNVHILGQLSTASNATLLCQLPDQRKVVYKPVRGERPLWDFPHATLGLREVLAFEAAQALGSDFIPSTVWVEDGPFGPGSIQEWCERPDESLVRVEPLDLMPHGFVSALQGEGEGGEPVHLLHADSIELQRIALFDIITNNADRKAGHLLGSTIDPVAIDHGLCFHPEPKLRTVLWGWAGKPISDEHLAWLSSIADASHPFYMRITESLSEREAHAFHVRVQSLMEEPVFPRPAATTPSLPWPLW